MINFYTHLEKYNKIAINSKQKKNPLNFQNEMHFLLLHYTSKNGMKGYECCKNPSQASNRRKIKRFQKMHVTTIKKQEIQKVPTI
jgi:hypothetical protein